MSKNKKFLLTVFIATLWAALSVFIGLQWINSISDTFGIILAWIIVLGIAVLPGFLNMYLLSTLLLDKQSKGRRYLLDHYPDIAVVIASYNEEDNIMECIQAIRRNNYPGQVEIIVADDGSVDRTYEVANRLGVTVLYQYENTGKASALNRALRHIVWHGKQKYFVTVDADTILHSQALSSIIGKLVKEKHGAVAGNLLLHNAYHNWITRLQQYDYLLGIASIKRQQSAYDATLVAQGAFSAYKTEAVARSYGWGDNHVGEDIVLTWDMIADGYTIAWEPRACAYTEAPTTFKGFITQRRRWARGMIEGMKECAFGYRGIYRKRGFSPVSFGITTNFMFLIIDTVYTFAFIPGLIAAICFQDYLLVGLVTLLVIPLNLILASVMYYRHRESMVKVGLEGPQGNWIGYVGYQLFYQLISSPISVLGYASELLGVKKSW